MTDILTVAREQVLERGVGLDEAQMLQVLRLPDDRLDELLALAHEVRMRWCGPEVEVEGIVCLKTGGCPEDCHFCSQSGLFDVAGARGVAGHPEPGRGGARDRGDGRDRVLHRRRRARPRRAADGAGARRASRRSATAVEINVACSLGMLTREQVDELAELGVHRYNHNLETARSYFANVVTTHTWEERWETLQIVRELGMEVCCGGILGMGETLEQRAEFAAQLAAARPDEVPLNFLNPRPGTPFGDLDRVGRTDALRAIAAFRLALPRTILRFAGGREITLGDLGARAGHARRHQRGDRRQLPDHARPAGGGTSTCSRSSRCRSRRCPPRCKDAWQVQRLYGRTGGHESADGRSARAGAAARTAPNADGE